MKRSRARAALVVAGAGALVVAGIAAASTAERPPSPARAPDAASIPPHSSAASDVIINPATGAILWRGSLPPGTTHLVALDPSTGSTTWRSTPAPPTAP